MQVCQIDAMRSGIWKPLIMPAGAGKLGVEVDGMAHVTDDEKRRAALIGGKCGDVFPSLVVGTLEHLVEGGSAPLAMAGFFLGSAGDEVEERAFLGGFGKGALLGLGEEAAGFVEVDEARGGGAVGGVVGDGTLENVAVLGIIRASGFRVGDVEDLVAEFGEEERVVGFFRAAGFFPSFDELGNGFRGGIGHGGFWIDGKVAAIPKDAHCATDETLARRGQIKATTFSPR